MASAFSHLVIPAVVYATFKSPSVNFRLFLLAALLSILPDADVIGFKFGVPYSSQWGHRGFTHSILFAFSAALIASLFSNFLRSKTFIVFFVCFVLCLSHALLDAMTNGGLGIELFWPFNHERIFLPFRPIQVSPIGVDSFFTGKGLRVIASEIKWIIAPGIILVLIGIFMRWKLRK